MDNDLNLIIIMDSFQQEQFEYWQLDINNETMQPCDINGIN